MEVLHYHTHEHVEQEEAHQKEECDEVKNPPFVVILYWLQRKIDLITIVISTISFVNKEGGGDIWDSYVKGRDYLSKGLTLSRNEDSDLGVHGDGVQSIVHDVHPAVLAGEDEETDESLAQVVKIIFPVPPAVIRERQTLRLGGDVLPWKQETLI